MNRTDGLEGSEVDTYRKQVRIRAILEEDAYAASCALQLMQGDAGNRARSRRRNDRLNVLVAILVHPLDARIHVEADVSRDDRNHDRCDEEETYYAPRDQILPPYLLEKRFQRSVRIRDARIMVVSGK